VDELTFVQKLRQVSEQVRQQAQTEVPADPATPPPADRLAGLRPRSKGRVIQQTWRTSGPFAKGPIPVAWFAAITRLRVPAVIGLCLWRCDAMRPRGEAAFDFNVSAQSRMTGLDRRVWSKWLRRLEVAELIAVMGRPGRKLRVELRPPGPTHGEGT
jgi:hypothetical protein